MNPVEQPRCKPLYAAMLRALKLQGMAEKTIEAYSRAIRRSAEFFVTLRSADQPGVVRLWPRRVSGPRAWGQRRPLSLYTRLKSLPMGCAGTVAVAGGV